MPSPHCSHLPCLCLTCYSRYGVRPHSILVTWARLRLVLSIQMRQWTSRDSGLSQVSSKPGLPTASVRAPVNASLASH